MTETPHIVLLRVCHKHIDTMIVALRMALQPPGSTGHRRQVCLIRNAQQQVVTSGINPGL